MTLNLSKSSNVVTNLFCILLFERVASLTFGMSFDSLTFGFSYSFSLVRGMLQRMFYNHIPPYSSNDNLNPTMRGITDIQVVMQDNLKRV